MAEISFTVDAHDRDLIAQIAALDNSARSVQDE